ncbi:cytochrome c oxidase assembly protein [Pseudogemmobacter sonorensis]|uniref:cytochrome c oxidase assembly protein n=1 Tax=Pseudogemmobacter sonorensis TaxID=2989681 RepID=UPI0036B954BB
MSNAVIPYCGPAPEAGNIWTSWNFDPPLLVALGVLLLGLPLVRAYRGAWLLGWAALVVAFVSPLCALTVALFSARALHHLLIVTLAAPLLALALPGLARRLPPGIALALTSIALILWHLPPVYDAAWHSPFVYWLLQGALLLPAVAFWSGLWALARRDIIAASGQLAGLAGLMGFIGAVLTFAPRVLFPQHGLAPIGFGLDPLRDQQLAGLLMWAPGLLPLGLIGGLMLRGAWARASGAERPGA